MKQVGRVEKKKNSFSFVPSMAGAEPELARPYLYFLCEETG